jgi:hypothetical protein
MTILAALLLATAQADAPLETRVSAYAVQLRDDATRDRARDRLVHLGKAGLPFLEKAEIDPALLLSVRQEIELNESLGTSYGPPHVFTFDGSEESLGVLLSRLETTGGMPLQKNSLDLAQKLSLKLEDATFWESLDEVCKKASIWYYPATEPLYLNGGMVSAKPRCYYGPIMIVMDRVIHQRRVLFSSVESEFTIRLLCVWEKSVSPLGVTGRYHVSTVTEDGGASLLPPTPKAAPVARSVSPVRIAGQAIDVNGLRPPSAAARKLDRVDGTLELEFPSRIDEVRFELAAEGATTGKEKAIEGARVELKSFAPKEAWGATTEIEITFQDPKEAAAFRIGASDVEFVVPGDPRRAGWVGGARVENDKFSFTAHWRNGGRPELPKEIRLRIPRGGVIKNVPFSFRNVDLK